MCKMKLSILIGCLLIINAVFAYRIEDDEDVELSEDQVKNFVKSYMIHQMQDNEEVDEYEAEQQQNEKEEDDEDEELEGMDEDEEWNANTEKDYQENEDSEEFNDEDSKQLTSELEKDDDVDAVGLRNGIDDDEELDELALNRALRKDPLWARFRVRRFRRFRFRRFRVRFPRIRLPRIRLPRIRLPRFRFRFPRIRFPRIRFPRIRFPRIRFRFRKPPGPGPQPENPCKHTESQVLNAINSIKCDPHWKTFFEYPSHKALVDHEAFISVCKVQKICVGCMNGNPWDKTQCNNKLKTNLNNICTALATEDDGSVNQETLTWCHGKVTSIVNYENGKSAGAEPFYCKCGAADLGNPANTD